MGALGKIACVAGVRKGKGIRERDLARGRRAPFLSPSRAQIPTSPSPFNACHILDPSAYRFGIVRKFWGTLRRCSQNLAPVVQKVDNAIHRINHCPLDNAIGFLNTYPLDSDLSGG